MTVNLLQLAFRSAAGPPVHFAVGWGRRAARVEDSQSDSDIRAGERFQSGKSRAGAILAGHGGIQAIIIHWTATSKCACIANVFNNSLQWEKGFVFSGNGPPVAEPESGPKPGLRR